jgi:hypothetical protein
MGTFTMDWNMASLPITSLVTSSSCPPEVTTITVVTNDADKTVTPGAVMASWSRDITNLSYGSINRGNTISVHGFAKYKVTATCGTSSSITTLTINIPAPHIASVSAPFCKEDCKVDVYGSGFVAANADLANYNSSYTWYGTSFYYYVNAKCNPNQGLYFGGYFKWISDTHIQLEISGTPGPISLNLQNQPSVDAGGGGTDCMNNAATITSSLTQFAVNNGLVLVSDQYNSTVTISDTTGTVLGTISSGQSLSPIITTDAVYATADYTDSQGNFIYGVAKFDLKTRTTTRIQLQAPGYYPTMIAQTSDGVVYVLARNNDRSRGMLLRLDGNTFTMVASADGYTSIEVQGTRVLWTVPSSDHVSSLVYIYNSATNTLENVYPLALPADTLLALNGGGLLAYHIGSTQAVYLDSHGFFQDGVVTVPQGLLLPQRGLVTLKDGSLSAVVGMTDGTIYGIKVVASAPAYVQLNAITTLQTTAKDPMQLYNGQAIGYVQGSGILATNGDPVSSGPSITHF